MVVGFAVAVTPYIDHAAVAFAANKVVMMLVRFPGNRTCGCPRSSGVVLNSFLPDNGSVPKKTRISQQLSPGSRIDPDINKPFDSQTHNLENKRQSGRWATNGPLWAGPKTRSTVKYKNPPAQQGVPMERKTGYEPATLTLAKG